MSPQLLDFIQSDTYFIVGLCGGGLFMEVGGYVSRVCGLMRSFIMVLLSSEGGFNVIGCLKYYFMVFRGRGIDS